MRERVRSASREMGRGGGGRRPLHTHFSRQGELWPLQVLRQKSRRCTSICLTLKHLRRVKKNDKLEEISIVIKGHLFFFCIHLVKKHTKMKKKKNTKPSYPIETHNYYIHGKFDSTRKNVSPCLCKHFCCSTFSSNEFSLHILPR